MVVSDWACRHMEKENRKKREKRKVQCNEGLLKKAWAWH